MCWPETVGHVEDVRREGAAGAQEKNGATAREDMGLGDLTVGGVL